MVAAPMVKPVVVLRIEGMRLGGGAAVGGWGVFEL